MPGLYSKCTVVLGCLLSCIHSGFLQVMIIGAHILKFKRCCSFSHTTVALDWYLVQNLMVSPNKSCMIVSLCSLEFLCPELWTYVCYFINISYKFEYSSNAYVQISLSRKREKIVYQCLCLLRVLRVSLCSQINIGFEEAK